MLLYCFVLEHKLSAIILNQKSEKFNNFKYKIDLSQETNAWFKTLAPLSFEQ